MTHAVEATGIFKNSPGQSLPGFIASRMVQLEHKPSWGVLASLTGIGVMTLQSGLKGRSGDFGIKKVRKIACVLKMTCDDFADQMGW